MAIFSVSKIHLVDKINVPFLPGCYDDTSIIRTHQCNQHITGDVNMNVLTFIILQEMLPSQFVLGLASLLIDGIADMIID